MKISRLRDVGAKGLYVALLPLLWASGSGAQTAKTTNYTYDELGRLTFVEDSQNGNRDYDYDKLGNRLNVAVGTASDAASVPPPLAVPANRTKSQNANCSWMVTWTHLPGAISYTIENTQNQNYTVSLSNSNPPGISASISGNTVTVYMSCPYNQPASNEPARVRACSPDSCSAYGAF